MKRPLYLYLVLITTMLHDSVVHLHIDCLEHHLESVCNLVSGLTAIQDVQVSLITRKSLSFFNSFLIQDHRLKMIA